MFSVSEPRLAAGFSEQEARAMTPAERMKHVTWVKLPYSEVCMHMRVAGQRRPVVALESNMAWILDADGSTFSFPVTRGEAGL